jgi:hypothetical protein
MSWENTQPVIDAPVKVKFEISDTETAYVAANAVAGIAVAAARATAMPIDFRDMNFSTNALCFSN